MSKGGRVRRMPALFTYWGVEAVTGGIDRTCGRSESGVLSRVFSEAAATA